MKNYIFNIHFKNGTIKQHIVTANKADEALDDLWQYFHNDWERIESNLTENEFKTLSKIPRVQITYK